MNFCYTSVFGMLESIKLTDLVLINKLYVNYSSEVNTTFLANASSSYGVHAEFVGFNMPVTAFAFINNEVSGCFVRGLLRDWPHCSVGSIELIFV